ARRSHVDPAPPSSLTAARTLSLKASDRCSMPCTDRACSANLTTTSLSSSPRMTRGQPGTIEPHCNTLPVMSSPVLRDERHKAFRDASPSPERGLVRTRVAKRIASGAYHAQRSREMWVVCAPTSRAAASCRRASPVSPVRKKREPLLSSRGGAGAPGSGSRRLAIRALESRRLEGRHGLNPPHAFAGVPNREGQHGLRVGRVDDIDEVEIALRVVHR